MLRNGMTRTRFSWPYFIVAAIVVLSVVGLSLWSGLSQTGHFIKNELVLENGSDVGIHVTLHIPAQTEPSDKKEGIDFVTDEIERLESWSYVEPKSSVVFPEGLVLLREMGIQDYIYIEFRVEGTDRMGGWSTLRSGQYLYTGGRKELQLTINNENKVEWVETEY